MLNYILFVGCQIEGGVVIHISILWTHVSVGKNKGHGIETNNY